MKAIIVAAGPGSRLNQLTRNKPKCLLDIGGRTIMERMLEVLRSNGIDDISVVRGWMSSMIDFPRVNYYENPDFRGNNILTSLFYAEAAMDDDFVFSYCDICYTSDIVTRLLDCRADVAVVVDVDWEEHYLGRDRHPIAEAELVQLRDGRVAQIGKRVVAVEEAHGEFIGLAKFSRAGIDMMKTVFHRVATENPDAPFHSAPSLKKAYIADMLQEMVDLGADIRPVDIHGGWSEVDTEQDLERARALFAQGIHKD